MTTTLSAREALLEAVKAQGWANDPEATYYTGSWTPEKKYALDPHVFIKGDGEGGTWRLALDFTNDSGYTTKHFGKTLKKVFLSHTDANGEPVKGHKKALKQPTRYYGSSHLYDVLGAGTLREKALKLAINPALALWEAAKAEYAFDQAFKAEQAAKHADKAERAKSPVGVKLDRESWDKLTNDLYWASRSVKDADGKTENIVEKLAEVRTLLEALEAHAS